MKQLIGILSLSLMCSSFSRQDFAPKVAKEIVAASGTITIDGNASEADWSNASWENLTYEWATGVYPSAADFTGRFKMLYDKNYIYLLTEITDDYYSNTLTAINENADYWKGDCIEIFVDEDASGGQHRASANAFAYHVTPANKWFDNNTSGAVTTYNSHGTMSKTQSGNTHVWECRFQLYPDSYIDNGVNQSVVLRKGKKIGLMFAYNDRDTDNGDREHMMGNKDIPGSSKNRGYQDASVFGTYFLK